MSAITDLRILYKMLLSPIRGADHAQRLESFYASQADGYDGFRTRLLQGRDALFERLPLTPGAVWVDMGAGTGSSLDFAGNRADALKKAYLVDLSPSLLTKARQRCAQRGLSHVEAVQADVTAFEPAEGADVVTFSYSLTMIPDWFAAIDRAQAILKPGGIVGVVDFYVSRKYAEQGRVRHNWFTRNGWPLWFASDNVFPNPDMLPYLERRFQGLERIEARARLPYLPLVQAPYFVFVGRKIQD